MHFLDRHFIGALCAISALLGCAAIPANARQAMQGCQLHVVLIAQKDGPNIGQDEAVAAHLRERGYQVRIEDQRLAPEKAGDADLVIISSTVSGKDVSPGWRWLPVPLMTWENDLLDDLAMSGKRHDTDFGSEPKERYLWLVNAPQFMSAGQPAGIANVYVKQASMSWGKPGLGATIIASLYGQPDKAAIFGYEKGATMDYESIAPARRVMFFLDNDTFSNLSPVGTRLFDAAVDWSIGTGG